MKHFTILFALFVAGCGGSGGGSTPPGSNGGGTVVTNTGRWTGQTRDAIGNPIGNALIVIHSNGSSSVNLTSTVSMDLTFSQAANGGSFVGTAQVNGASLPGSGQFSYQEGPVFRGDSPFFHFWYLASPGHAVHYYLDAVKDAG